MKVNTDLAEDSVKEIVDRLLEILADNYVLYFKTLNCHWNVEDPRFLMLHELFEQQYEALEDQGDSLAERIRMLGAKFIASMGTFLQNASLQETSREFTADEMIKDLAEAHEKVISKLRNAISLTTDLNDPGTADLLTDAIRFHEKTLWFLQSHLY